MIMRSSRFMAAGILALGAALLAAGAPQGIGQGFRAAPGMRAAPSANGIVFSDLGGRLFTYRDIRAHRASVFLFISGQCPISNIYTPRMNALAATYGPQGVALFAVYSDRQESAPEIQRHAREHGLTFPVVKDSAGVLADRLGATVTPQAIVVDSSGTVRYRGRIDNNAVATRATKHDLADALSSLAAGQPVARPETSAVGCAIRRVPAAVAARAGVPTYAGDVAAILRAKCEGCHRPGEVAPFSLQNYKQASAWAVDIKRYTASGQMPPWKPVPDYGAFKEAGAHTLSAGERATLAKWADNGTPMGNPKKLPPPRKFVQGWQLGTPDLVMIPEKAYHLSADGEDVYRNFVIKTNFAEDRFVSAVEVRPGNAGVVHHVIGYVDSYKQSGGYASERLEAATTDGQPGYTSFGGPGFVPTGMMAGWAPGNDPHFLPEGVGILVPKGSRVVMQVHYHKDGKPEEDQTRLGVYFCKGRVDKAVTGGIAINFGFRIPPGDPHYKAEGSITIAEPQHLFAVTPHMHLLGREMKVWATLPDGTDKPLVWIKDWDFNWQATYYLKEPLALPAGTRLRMTAYYDNSSQNLRNPLRANPRTVTWGEQTTDEMCVAFFSTTKDNEHLNVLSSAAGKQTISAR